jgi:hypothetical protein
LSPGKALGIVPSPRLLGKDVLLLAWTKCDFLLFLEKPGRKERGDKKRSTFAGVLCYFA